VPERYDDLVHELELLEARLGEVYASGDQDAIRDVGRRHAELKPVVDVVRALGAARADLAAARELEGGELDDDSRAFVRAEQAEHDAEIARLEDELRALLLPSDPNAGRAVLLEIRGAEGGEEAKLFAKDLADMYLRYAEARGWRVSVLEAHPSDMGGWSEIILRVEGPDAWQRLHHEGGPHRVQRVPVTESQGRIHTSSATVTVLPEADEVDVAIDPADLRVDVYRSSGPGGQSVNTTDSAVRVTHVPTGIVVAMQDEKSQLQNRVKAMQVLRSRLLKAEQDRQAAEQSASRKAQVGGGGRSEKVRTYHFKENRVTDHRVNLTLYQLDRILGGDLDEVVDALLAAERREQLGEAD
jgi:peptide chain release factor 1